MELFETCLGTTVSNCLLLVQGPALACSSNSMMPCRMLRFPKPQMVVYSLFVVPVVFGASKLIAADSYNAGNHVGPAVAINVLLPLPVFAYWLYVLWRLPTPESPTLARRTKASIMRTYAKPGEGTADASNSGSFRPKLALLGSAEDNPTLILRDLQPGELYENPFDDSSSSSDDSDGAGALGTHSRRSQLATASVHHLGRPGPTTSTPRPWHSVSGAAETGTASGVLGSTAGQLRAGANKGL